MKLPSYSLYGGGLTPSSSQNMFFMFAPASINTTDTRAPIGKYLATLTSLGGAGQGIILGNATWDLLNGGVVESALDSEGVPYMRYSNPGFSDTAWLKYMGMSAAAGPGADVPQDDPRNSVPAHTINANALGDNWMAFVCARFGPSDINANITKIGFDVNGFNYPVVMSSGTISGAIGMNLNASIGGASPGCGAIQTAGVAYASLKAYYSIAGSFVPPTFNGRVARCMAVNGVTNSVQKLYSPNITSPSVTNDGPVDATTPWKSLGVHPISVNLGANCSSEAGVYFMGIRRYSAAIPDAELERVTRFMQATGKLPPWWG